MSFLLKLRGAGFLFLEVFDPPPLTGDVLVEVLWKKSATAGSLDGCGWRELKALPAPWFDGLARILRLVEEQGSGLRGFWMPILP